MDENMLYYFLELDICTYLCTSMNSCNIYIMCSSHVGNNTNKYSMIDDLFGELLPDLYWWQPTPVEDDVN